MKFWNDMKIYNESQLLHVMKSIKCTISRIYFFNKVLWDFPGLNTKNSRTFPGVSRDYKGLKNFPGFSRISRPRTNPDRHFQPPRPNRPLIFTILSTHNSQLLSLFSADCRWATDCRTSSRDFLPYKLNLIS